MTPSPGASSLPPTPTLSRMKTRVRQRSAPTRAKRLRLERPELPRRQRPRRKPRKQRKPKRRRKQRKHRGHARPLSANGKLAAAKTGERLRNRRLNPKELSSFLDTI